MIRKIFMLLIGVIFFLSSCGTANHDTYTYEAPVVSPSGKYQIEILSGYNGVVHYKRFNIASLKNKFEPEVIYCSADTFRNRDRTYFVWDDNEDVVWVYSGDVGTFYWEQNEQGEWIKYEKQDKEYPDTLKKLIVEQSRE